VKAESVVPKKEKEGTVMWTLHACMVQLTRAKVFA